MSNYRPIFTSIISLILIGFFSNIHAMGTSTVTTDSANMQSPLHTIMDLSKQEIKVGEEPKKELTSDEKAVFSQLSREQQDKISKLSLEAQKKVIADAKKMLLSQIQIPSSEVQLSGQINSSIIIGTPQQDITIQVLSTPPVYVPSLIIIAPPIADISCSLP